MRTARGCTSVRRLAFHDLARMETGCDQGYSRSGRGRRIFSFTRGRQGNPMTPLDRNLPQHKATSADRGRSIPQYSYQYFARHRLVLYFLLGVGSSAAAALNWNWLAAAGLLPLVALLPCMMMISCA